ncbi:hypothetical protein EBZ80_15955, partial [bacterium]|nr:hypothetical protein [bacterium]
MPLLGASLLLGAFLLMQKPSACEEVQEETREDYTTLPSFQTRIQNVISQDGKFVGAPTYSQKQLCNRPNTDFIQVPG